MAVVVEIEGLYVHSGGVGGGPEAGTWGLSTISRPGDTGSLTRCLSRFIHTLDQL